MGEQVFWVGRAAAFAITEVVLLLVDGKEWIRHFLCLLLHRRDEHRYLKTLTVESNTYAASGDDAQSRV